MFDITLPLWLDDFLWAYGSVIYGLGVNAILGLSLYVVLALVGLLLSLRSKVGRAFEAIREDEDAARVVGINVWGYKLGAIVVSAALAGLAGALNAHYSSFIGPNEYGFETAVSILSFAVLGG